MNFLPVALLTALDVALTNMSYSLVGLSVITTVRSTSVAIMYGLSISMGLEKFNLKLFLVLIWLCISVAAGVPGMKVNSLLGLGVVVLSMLCGAFRWVLVHRLLADQSSGKPSSTACLRLIQPLAAICLLPAAAVFEFPDLIDRVVRYPPNFARLMGLIAILFISVALAVTLLMTEYVLISRTSSLALSVSGIAKECFVILIAVVGFGERLTQEAAIGVISSILAIGLYSYLRVRVQTQQRSSVYVKAPPQPAKPRGEPVHTIDITSLGNGTLDKSSSSFKGGKRLSIEGV